MLFFITLGIIFLNTQRASLNHPRTGVEGDVNGELLSDLKCNQFIIILSSITADSVKTVSPAAVNHTLVQALMDKVTVDGQSTIIMTIH